MYLCFSLQFYLPGERWGFAALLWANQTGQTCDLRGHAVIVQLNMENSTNRLRYLPRYNHEKK